jgi:hypothetical protein
MPYQLTTPWQGETWISGSQYSPYARLAGRPLSGGHGFLTDIGRGVTLIVNGTTVTETRFPYQNDLADATTYYLGGHSYTLTDAEAQVLIDAGYGEYLTPIV